MKLGMNMLLWSADVTGPEYGATFEMLKNVGFDGVEIPIFDREVDKYGELGERRGLTQAQLAARARTSQPAISRVERGLVSPSVATLATLLDLMGEALCLDAEQIDYGHDRTLFAATLARTPEERIESQARWSRGMNELRRSSSTRGRSRTARTSPSTPA